MRKVNLKDIEERVRQSPKGKFGRRMKEISVALGRDPFAESTEEAEHTVIETVVRDDLVTFEEMYPSVAMLPSAERAALGPMHPGRVDVIGGGVGGGVAGTQQAGQRLARLGEITEQRMEAEAALVVAGRFFLLGVGGDQGGADLHPANLTKQG